jgi:hypothetical protein
MTKRRKIIVWDDSNPWTESSIDKVTGRILILPF